MKSFAKILPLAIIATACGVETAGTSSLDEAWNRANDPSQMDYVYLTQERDYQVNFASLPTSGALSETPWSDNYYPTYKGGITYRWNKKAETEQDKYAYDIAYRTRGLKYLSPAEKYDIFIGARHMPLTNYERERTNIMATVSGQEKFDKEFEIPTWEGLCHAWAPATIAYKEPQPVTLTGANGVRVPFASSDIKALLTYFLHLNDSETQFLGGRCNLDFAALERKVADGTMTRKEMQRLKNSSECRDTNAGAFHVVVANQLGRLDEGFVIDVTSDAEVWNQPVYKFSSEVVRDNLAPGPKAARGTVKEVEIATRLHYVVEVNESYKPNNSGSLTSKLYRYRLELDANGDIIGGEWLDTDLKNDRPDFLWKRATPEFQGFFDELEGIYKASIR